MACTDVVELLVIENRQGVECCSVVQEWFALTHADKIGHTLAEILADGMDLVNDFTHTEIASESFVSGGAECALHGTSNLRGKTHGQTIAVGSALGRDCYRFDEIAIGEPQEILPRSIDGDLAIKDGCRMQRIFCCKELDESLGKVGNLVVARNILSIEPLDELFGAKRRKTGLFDDGRDLIKRALFNWFLHISII